MPEPNSPRKFRLRFLAVAKAEWDKLDASIQLQFAKVLAKRLEQPHVPKAALAAMPNCYKIKLRGVGYRLVYMLLKREVVLLVVAVGKRDRNAVYDAALARLPELLSNHATPPAKSSFKPESRTRKRP